MGKWREHTHVLTSVLSPVFSLLGDQVPGIQVSKLFRDGRRDSRRWGGGGYL